MSDCNEKILGAIMGDVLGSPYEWDEITSRHFNLMNKECKYTDDTVMTVAVMEWLLQSVDGGVEALTEKSLTDIFRKWGRKYHKAGYGSRFRAWLRSDDYEPIDSFGNGSAMRVSPVAWWFDNEEDVLRFAERSAVVSHNHEEGIKGAKAVALAIFMARNHTPRHKIAEEITERFGYNLRRSIEDIKPTYKFDATCQGSVPESIISYMESRDVESAIINAIWLGGDTDTMADMAAAIAEARYGIDSASSKLREFVWDKLTDPMREVITKFSEVVKERLNKK